MTFLRTAKFNLAPEGGRAGGIRFCGGKSRRPRNFTASGVTWAGSKMKERGTEIFRKYTDLMHENMFKGACTRDGEDHLLNDLDRRSRLFV